VARVFVSHASGDREPIDEVHRWLIDEGHDVFLDRDLCGGIVVGEEWEQRLHERLRWADAVVCVVTSAYLASMWCTAEVSIALARGSRLLPVLAERGVIHPLLKCTQYADLVGDSVVARASLVEALRRIDASGGSGWPDGQSPFPGLRSFDVELHRVFFGRSSEVEQLAGLLRSPAERAERAVLLVIGPSGCGKSSLVRAGLLPVMLGESGWWALPPILPGADPVTALVQELAAAARQIGLEWTAAHVRHRLDDCGGLTDLVNELLLAAPGGSRRRLLIVVDQFEELLVQAAPGPRLRFVQLLRPALEGPVRVVATLRPEFLDELLLNSELAVFPTRIYTLRPLRPEALSVVIEGPARLAGIKVEDHLVARLVADTDSGEALPLLAFTLAQLVDGVGRGGQLSGARYDQLGGVQGALTRQADAALMEAVAAGGRSRDEVIAGLLRLVTVDEHGHPTRWRVHRDELPNSLRKELDVFVARRLLITDMDNNGVIIEVAHEAFLSAWQPLAQAIAAAASGLRARRLIEQAATEWSNNDRSPSRLWERGQLAAAVADIGAYVQALDRSNKAALAKGPSQSTKFRPSDRLRRRQVLVTDRVDLSLTACAFLHASIRRDRYLRRRAITVLSVLLALALVAAGIAIVQQRTAEEQRNVAVSRQVAGEALALRAANPALSAQLSLAAYRLVPTPEARGSLLSTFATLYATRLTSHTSAVYAAAFSPDGRTLATASTDRTARLWDVTDPHNPTAIATLTGHTNGVVSVAFSPDGHTLATASYDHTAWLWDITDRHYPTVIARLTGHMESIRRLTFSPDGHTLATASYDHTARLWDVTNPRNPSLLATIVGHREILTAAVFSPDGHTLATAGNDNPVRLWDITDLRHPRPLPDLTGHIDRVLSAAFSPDGRILATGSFDRTVRLWNTTDPHHPAPLATLTGHSNGIVAIAFSPDGHTLATGSYDRTARLWDIADVHNVNVTATYNGHADTVYAVAFSPDGNTLATGSADNTARLWDVHQPILGGHTRWVGSVAISPDKRTLATGSLDTTTRLWNIADPTGSSLLTTLSGHTDGVSSIAFSPNGRILATGSLDSTIRLWDITDPAHPHTIAILTDHTNNVFSVAFSPDGRILATAGNDNPVRLWDITDPSHPRVIAAFTDHTGNTNSVTISPDGRTLATAGSDLTARLWDITDPGHPRTMTTLTGHTNNVLAVAFSSDGRTLATGSADQTARLWDITDPHHTFLMATLAGHSNSVNSVTFSPDRRVLLTGSDDNTAQLWDITDLRNPGSPTTLTGHADAVKSVIFSPDGHTVITGSNDSTVRLWDTDVDRIAKQICTVVHPSITRAEWNRYFPGLTYQAPCERRRSS
jgi:WD40 repeat protein